MGQSPTPLVIERKSNAPTPAARGDWRWRCNWIPTTAAQPRPRKRCTHSIPYTSSRKTANGLRELNSDSESSWNRPIKQGCNSSPCEGRHANSVTYLQRIGDWRVRVKIRNLTEAWWSGNRTGGCGSRGRRLLNSSRPLLQPPHLPPLPRGSSS